MAAAPAAEATHPWICNPTTVPAANYAWCGANCTWDTITGGGIKHALECWGLLA